MSDATSYRRYRVKSPMEFRVDVHQVPEVPEKGYLVRVEVCGLCRSDLYFATDWASDWDDLGHEFGGTVVAVADGEDGFRMGDRVAVKNAAACLECAACLRGDLRGCSSIVVNKLGFSQFADCDRRSLVRAEGLSDALLSIVEPTNVALDMINSAEIDGTQRIAVLGTGTLGLITAYLLENYFQVPHVVLVGRRPDKKMLAHLGLTRCLSFEQLAEKTPLASLLGGSPERVLVTTPPSTLSGALEACGPAGRVLAVGLDREEGLSATIDVRTLIFKRARVQGVFAVPNLYFEDAVRILREVGTPLERLIRRRIAFEELEDALREWDRRPHFDGKSVLELHATPRSRLEATLASGAMPVGEAACQLGD